MSLRVCKVDTYNLKWAIIRENMICFWYSVCLSVFEIGWAQRLAINLDDSWLHKCVVANFRDAVHCAFLNYLRIYKSSMSDGLDDMLGPWRFHQGHLEAGKSRCFYDTRRHRVPLRYCPGEKGVLVGLRTGV